MEITRVLINNFRCIKHADITLGHTTVFIGPNNVGKTAILDAVRIAMTRRWGLRGTGFTENDIHLPSGIADPKQAPPINIQIEFQERSLNEWSDDLQNALDDIIQIDPLTGRSIIILNVTCGISAANGALDPKWEFFNIDRQPLTGKGARSTNLQEIFQYLPVFYLKPARDADDEFSARSQFWGRLLKAMNVPAALQATLKTESTTSTNNSSMPTLASPPWLPASRASRKSPRQSHQATSNSEPSHYNPGTCSKRPRSSTKHTKTNHGFPSPATATACKALQ